MEAKKPNAKKFQDYTLCEQWNLIYRYFKTTVEPYDELDFDGKELAIWLDGEIIEKYSLQCLNKLMKFR